MGATELRAKAARIESAQQKANKLLSRTWTEKQKAKFFDAVYPVAAEHLQLLLEDGHSNQWVKDAFRGSVLLAAFGENFYEDLESPLREAAD